MCFLPSPLCQPDSQARCHPRILPAASCPPHPRQPDLPAPQQELDGSCTLGGGSGWTRTAQELGWHGKSFIPVRAFWGTPSAGWKPRSRAAPVLPRPVDVEPGLSRGEALAGVGWGGSSSGPFENGTCSLGVGGWTLSPGLSPPPRTWRLPSGTRARQAGSLHMRSPLQPRPHHRGWSQREAVTGSVSRQRSLGAGAGGLGSTFPSSHLPTWDAPALDGAGGPHRCRQHPRCRARLPRDNTRVFFIFKALPALIFILAPPQPTWEVSTIAAPSRSPRGAGTQPSSAALCRSRARREGRAAWLAQCWLRHRGESRQPGLCRDLPDPTAAPVVPAGPRAGTPWHGIRWSHRHPAVQHASAC